MPLLTPTPLPGWGQVGESVSVAEVLERASERLRPAFAPGLRVRRAWAWSAADRVDRTWWPQGITCSADAGRRDRLLLVSWYATAGGVRISVVDRTTHRYVHVPLALPTGDGGLGPLPIHAGGLAWTGTWLHVAATGRGLYSAHLDDIRRLPNGKLLWPVRLHLQPPPDDHAHFRYSFLSVTDEGELLAGEYGRGEQSTRLVRFGLDADGLPATAIALDPGVRQMQGAIRRGERYLITASRGTRRPGSLVVGSANALREHRYATPIGPEDLTWSDGLLWTATEHPGKRWIVGLRPPRA